MFCPAHNIISIIHLLVILLYKTTNALQDCQGTVPVKVLKLSLGNMRKYYFVGSGIITLEKAIRRRACSLEQVSLETCSSNVMFVSVFNPIFVLPSGSGLAVITVMLVTTCLMCLVIVLCWHQSIFLAICFLLLFGTIETLFFSASLIKFLEGAWVPIVLAFILMTLMYSWHYGTLKKYEFDVANKIPVNWLLSLGPSLGIVRVRGIGLIHTELTSGIPVIFSHFVTNLPAFHQVLVFVCVKSLPVPHVKKEERFLVGHIGPRQYRLYRCIARYGYRDVQKDDLEFEDDLVLTIAEFIQTGKAALNDSDGNWLREDENMAVVGTPSTRAGKIQMCRGEIGDDDGAPGLKPPVRQARKRVRFAIPEIQQMDLRACEGLRELMEAREAGVAHILGHSYMRSKKRSSLLKKLVIDYGYEVLRRNCRTPTYALSLPNASTLEVGMVYHV